MKTTWNGAEVQQIQREIVSAFALCGKSKGDKEITWQNNQGKALYLKRWGGVNVYYIHAGNGSLALERAKETARELGAS